MVSKPSLFEIDGIKGPNAKKEAFPLPINIDAKKIIRVKNTHINTPPKPRFSETETKPFIKPNEISPLANISAVTIRVTTLLNMFAIPSQKIVKELINCLKSLVRASSKSTAIKKLIIIAVVVSNDVVLENGFMSFEKTISNNIGISGMMANALGAVELCGTSEIFGSGEKDSFLSKYLLVK